MDDIHRLVFELQELCASKTHKNKRHKVYETDYLMNKISRDNAKGRHKNKKHKISIKNNDIQKESDQDYILNSKENFNVNRNFSLKESEDKSKEIMNISYR